LSRATAKGLQMGVASVKGLYTSATCTLAEETVSHTHSHEREDFAFNQRPIGADFQLVLFRGMADDSDILLNSREVAFLLDISPDLVNDFARRNILPAFKKGRQWRFREKDIRSAKRQLAQRIKAAA
jgi:hypothetical protein